MKYAAYGEISFPALRGKQGARTMYFILPNNETLNNIVPPDIEPDAERSQRAFDPAHAKGIAQYIVSNKDEYVLGALTYGCDQEGRWEPVEDGAPFGLLHLPLSAKLRSVDGQHRRRGLKDAIDLADWVAGDETAVLIYVEADVDKRRQMFSDMNWTVRAVSKSVNIGFNSRDPFARATNRLVATHPLLEGRVETERASISKGSTHIFTLGAIYDALKRLQVGPEGRVRKETSIDEDEIHDLGESFFTLLLETRPEYKTAVADPDKVEELRKSSLLFSGTTLKMLAGAVNWAMKRDRLLADLAKPIHDLDFRPDAKIWQVSGFVAPGTTTPMSRNQEVRAAALAVLDTIAPERIEAATVA